VNLHEEGAQGRNFWNLQQEHDEEENDQEEHARQCDRMGHLCSTAQEALLPQKQRLTSRTCEKLASQLLSGLHSTNIYHDYLSWC